MSKTPAIKNAYSSVSAADTMGQIQSLLSKHGAHEIRTHYDNGEPVAIAFAMMLNDNDAPGKIGREVFFKLEVNVEGLLRAMKQDKNTPNSRANREQAKRTAWKNKLEWLQIQLAEIATGQATAPQLLLGYAVTGNGQPLYERLKQQPKLLSD